MSTLTDDTVAIARAERVGGGLVLALVSAASFGSSGSLASGLFSSGWTPAAVVLVRLGIASVVLAPFGLGALRGRGQQVRRHLGALVLYGVLACAGAQFCYFSAVEHMQVGPAILIEYTSPAAVVVWLWLRHAQRPAPMTVAGAALAALGLVLVLDLLGGGAGLSLVGVLWALGAMVGGASYFLLNADGVIAVPPIALAWLGLVIGTVVFALLSLAQVMPLHAATTPVALAGGQVGWWVPVLLLGVVTAALAYATGVAAGRVLGSRLASFVALFEVVASVLFAWLLLDELPHPWQLVGGLLILAGVVAVKLGEKAAR